MVYYKPVKITIDTSSLAGVIINKVVRYYSLPDSIMTNWGLAFTSKFLSSLCYYLKIKWKLSTAFFLQTDSQTERQNSSMEAYFCTFVNFE